MMVTLVQPDRRAIAAVSRPTVPAPITRALDAVLRAARLDACMATDKGSRRAAASKLTFFGILVCRIHIS